MLISLVGFGILRPSKKKLRPGISPLRQGKYYVELQLQGLGQKLDMGFFSIERKAQRAYDVARFYTGNEDGEFYFEDTPTLLSQVRRPIESFESVSRGEITFQKFQKDLRSIAGEVIRIDDLFNAVNTLPNIDAENKDIDASASGETLVQVNYFRLAIAN